MNEYMTTSNITIINITKIFPEDQFEVTVKEHSSSSTITVRSRTTPATGICLQLIITPLETIVVSGLAKCNGVTQKEGSGAALMLKVKQLAKTLKINTIQLYDDSKVRVCDGNGNTEIDLFRLKILTKGKSWYNSLGYKSEYYAEEIEHNREVITSPMSKVASELKLKLKLDAEPLPDETVQQYITRLLQLQHIHPHPHPPCEHENGAYLKHVIDNVSKLLWYERMLEKKIRMRSSSSSSSSSKSGGIRRIRRRRTRKTRTNGTNHRNHPTTACRNSWSKNRDSV